MAYERHRQDFERRYQGKYVLIDIRSEKVFVAESPEEAYRRVAADRVEGPFHLVRVGERAASPAEWRRYAGRPIAATVPSYGSRADRYHPAILRQSHPRPRRSRWIRSYPAWERRGYRAARTRGAARRHLTDGGVSGVVRFAIVVDRAGENTKRIRHRVDHRLSEQRGVPGLQLLASRETGSPAGLRR